MGKAQGSSKSSLDAVRQRIERIETLFQGQLAKGQFDNARLIVGQIGQLLPDDPLVYSMRGRLLLAEEKYDGARQQLAEGLARYPHHFDLLFHLGRLYEQQEEPLHAYHMYAQAEYVAVAADQKAEITKAMRRLKGEGEWGVGAFGADAFVIELPGTGSSSVRITYSVSALRARKALYDSVTAHVHLDVEKVLEIECGEGTVARNLAALGLDVVGMDSDGRFLTAAILLDMHARLRAPEHERRLRLVASAVTPEQAALLRGQYDVIVYSPRWSRMREEPKERLVALLTNLFDAARLQVFVAVPAVDREGSSEDEGERPEGEGEKHGTEEVRRKFEAALQEALAAADVRWSRLTDGDDAYDGIYKIDIAEAHPDGGAGGLVPRGLEVLASRSELVDVELDKCRDLQAFGYTDSHWHPFVAQIKEHIEHPELTYGQSILREFYEAFQPRNRHEQFFGRRGKPTRPMHRGWALLPWLEGKAREIPLEPFQTRPGGTHFHGPNTDEFGQAEFQRVLAAYRMMKELGYEPEMYPDGYIQGFFLKSGDDYRFVVTEGQHRIAALAASGQDVVRCRIAPDAHFIACVDIDRILVWPQVKRRLYTPDLARRIFHLFFDSDPVQRLREWGLNVRPFENPR